MRNSSDDAYDEVVRDGQSVRVPITLMDSTQRAIFDARLHQPGYRIRPADAASHDAAAARLRYIADLESAYRSPAQRSTIDSTTPAPDARRPLSVADAQSVRNAAYDQMCQRISAAWQVRPQDQAPDDPYEADPDEADVIEQQRKQVTAEDLERQRRKLHANFSRSLSEAWKSR